ncbi:MAG: hemin uptake protein HemP [Ferrovibrio sp.]
MTELDRARLGGQAQTEGEAETVALALDGGLPRLSSRTLFRAAREIIIEHDGADYRLRLTANGKLILTK